MVMSTDWTERYGDVERVYRKVWSCRENGTKVMVISKIWTER